ncbi:MAG: F0F1 ATP synthase subunit gamma, partial [Rhodobiaceae bacterium]|nr:F0F1 ATP synthase subunit gamma [Rhodobiaceae bacterium]
AAERHIVIALCAEQGFVGGFNSRILKAVAERIAEEGAERTDLLLVGSRGLAVADEMGLAVAWSAPMAEHVDQVTSLANRLADTLFERLQGGAVTQVTTIHARPSSDSAPAGLVEQTLMPFDFSRFPPANRANPPLIHLPAPDLLARLADEYVFAELCEALTLSCAAENEARMRAMVAARDNVEERLQDLTAQARLLRQEQITEEVIELAAGSTA